MPAAKKSSAKRIMKDMGKIVDIVSPIKISKKSSTAKSGKFTPLQKAEVRAVKAGAKSAKLSGTMSKASRNSMQLNQEFNQGYISGKKDIAAFKRNQAKKKKK